MSNGGFGDESVYQVVNIYTCIFLPVSQDVPFDSLYKVLSFFRFGRVSAQDGLFALILWYVTITFY